MSRPSDNPDLVQCDFPLSIKKKLRGTPQEAEAVIAFEQHISAVFKETWVVYFAEKF